MRRLFRTRQLIGWEAPHVCLGFQGAGRHGLRAGVLMTPVRGPVRPPRDVIRRPTIARLAEIVPAQPFPKNR